MDVPTTFFALIDHVYVVFGTRLALKVVVNVLHAASQLMDPLTLGFIEPIKPDDVFIGWLKVTETSDIVTETPVAPSDGDDETTVGGTVSIVLKLHE
jgi:hypothetical protein